MPKITDPQCKKCRREGEKLFLKGEKCNSTKCPILKRNFPPGIHGAKGRKRITQYGQQLREKQKAKRIYGINEQQFRNYFSKASQRKGNTEEILSQLLEKRLDNVICHLGWANSRREARQMVSHNFFLINDKKVNIPSYQVKPKQIITIKPSKLKTKKFENLKAKLKKQEIPSWLNLDLENLKAKVTSEPPIEEIKQNLIAERKILISL